MRKKIKSLIFTFKENLCYFRNYLYNYIITYVPCYTLRHLYLTKIMKIKIGKDSFVHLGCYFNGDDIVIGNNTVIGRNVEIIGEVHIGNNCAITTSTIIQSVTHDKNSPDFVGVHNPIDIDNYVWIGMRSIVLPGVKIGEGCIIGANSTVTALSGGGAIPPCSVYAGSPAKKISERSPGALQYILNYKPMFN